MLTWSWAEAYFFCRFVTGPCSTELSGSQVSGSVLSLDPNHSDIVLLRDHKDRTVSRPEPMVWNYHDLRQLPSCRGILGCLALERAEAATRLDKLSLGCPSSPCILIKQ